MISNESTNKKLTRVYVALELTREVVHRGGVNNETSRSMLTFVNVASKILEELVADLPDTLPQETPETPEFEMLM